MNKITVKTFCKEYNSRATELLKKQYIKENLRINSYVPFVTKLTLVNNLANVTMIDKETGNVKFDSIVEHLLMTRIFIEQYTNLTVETDGFFEEYDELKKSGLFDILLIGNEAANLPPMIPYDEIVEFKFLLAQKRNDLLTNKYEIHSFIKEQIDRLKDLASATLTPLIEVVDKKLAEIPSEELQNKILEFVKKDDFKEVQ